jgi:hypothetical protein
VGLAKLLAHQLLKETPEFLSGTSAWEQHAPFALLLIDLLRPKTLVELGTHKGDSYLAFCQAIAKLQIQCDAYAVDTWVGEEHAGLYDEEIYTTLNTYHTPRYGSFSTLIRNSFDEAAQQLRDKKIDLLHIDGLHTYEAVKHDFETWLPLMSESGIVLFHDTQVTERGFGVCTLWQELRARYPHFEFLHGNGLGILGVGRQITPDATFLFNLTDEEQQALRALFEHLGVLVSQLSWARREQEAASREAALSRKSLDECRKNALSDKEKFEGRVRELEGQVMETEKKLRSIYSSASWRLTQPLRKMADSVRALRGGRALR